MVGVDSMGADLRLFGARFSNFLPGKLSRELKLRRMSIFHDIHVAIFRYCMNIVGHAGSTAGIVHADVTFQPFGHNIHGRKLGAVAAVHPFWGRESWVPI